MNDQQHNGGLPDWENFPSTKAQDVVPIKGNAKPSKPPAKSRLLRWTVGVMSICLALILLGAVLVAIVLSQGPISNESLRGQIEAQLNQLIGPDHGAKIKSTKLALGKNGLLALDAEDVTISAVRGGPLGSIDSVAVKLHASPLIRGEVKVERLALRGGRLSVNPADRVSQESKEWPAWINFSQSLSALSSTFLQLVRSINEADLKEITLTDVDLVGFQELPFRSDSARLVAFKVERDVNFQKGLFFKGLLETQHSNWSYSGAWRETDDGHRLSLSGDGIDLFDLHKSEVVLSDGRSQDVRGELAFSLDAPFLADGTPQQAVLSIRIDNALLPSAGGSSHARLESGAFNFRLLPSKNQIELERSPIRFGTTKMVLIGGLRYPADESAAKEKQPLFQIAGNDLTAYGIIDTPAPMKAAFSFSGVIDTTAKAFLANDVRFLTPNGSVEGEGAVSMKVGKPHLIAHLEIPKMPVAEFKQFWPEFLAQKTRNWAKEGVHGGQIENAWLKLNFPPGLLGDLAKYTAENISADVPLHNVSVKTAGALPRIDKTFGRVAYAGTAADITIDRGVLQLGGDGDVEVTAGTMALRNDAALKMKADMNLSIKGPARGLAKLGTLKPLAFSDKFNIVPNSLTGQAEARIGANFYLQELKDKGIKDWKADIRLNNVTARTPLLGRKVENARVDIAASPGIARIDGTAKVDGVNAKLAMVERLDNSQKSQRDISLILDDNARKKMGIDDGGIISGPIAVTVQSKGNGADLIKANLKDAKLSLPWIGWSKGSGIPATAQFQLETKGSATTISNFRLEGSGFSTSGKIKLDAKGLASANFKDVKLNKADDFDVGITRGGKGLEVVISARSYDGRAIIQSILKGSSAQSLNTKGQRVSVRGTVGRLDGFGSQSLKNVSLDFLHANGRTQRAVVKAIADQNAPTIFSLTNVKGGTKSAISTSNAGSVLQFLDLYTKMRGGTISAELVRDQSNVFRGRVIANNFTLLKEPRLAKLLQKPRVTQNIDNGDQVVEAIRRLPVENVRIEQLHAEIEKGTGFLNISRGRLSGGDASAAFSGRVYDRNGRMNVKGTFLPARTLNRLVSNIPILGLAFGKGKVNGLLGITFRLRGRYGNPRLEVNPLSIIAPGVFREIFKF